MPLCPFCFAYHLPVCKQDKRQAQMLVRIESHVIENKLKILAQNRKEQQKLQAKRDRAALRDTFWKEIAGYEKLQKEIEEGRTLDKWLILSRQTGQKKEVSDIKLYKLGDMGEVGKPYCLGDIK